MTMTLAFVIGLAGLIIWFVASKVHSIADAWLSEFGRICFMVGLLVYLLGAKGSLY